MEWLGSAIEKFGIPTGVLLVLLVFIWRVGVWFRDKVATPLVENHISLIRKLEVNDDKKTVALDSLAHSQEKQTEIMEQIHCVNGRLKGD